MFKVEHGCAFLTKNGIQFRLSRSGAKEGFPFRTQGDQAPGAMRTVAVPRMSSDAAPTRSS